MESQPTRIVPGAPPPTPLSKSQKKKRKTKVKSFEDAPLSTPTSKSAALVEKAVTPDIQEASLGPEPVPQSHVKAPSEDDPSDKPSPIVELVHKRLKATSKNILRISTYAQMDPEKLNDDQKRTLNTLPALEAVQKELGEVKKAVEVHEAELAHKLAAKRAEAQKAEEVRLSEAIAATQVQCIPFPAASGLLNTFGPGLRCSQDFGCSRVPTSTFRPLCRPSGCFGAEFRQGRRSRRLFCQ
jgi:hypothetical protein